MTGFHPRHRNHKALDIPKQFYLHSIRKCFSKFKVNFRLVRVCISPAANEMQVYFILNCVYVVCDVFFLLVTMFVFRILL